MLKTLRSFLNKKFAAVLAAFLLTATGCVSNLQEASSELPDSKAEASSELPQSSMTESVPESIAESMPESTPEPESTPAPESQPQGGDTTPGDDTERDYSYFDDAVFIGDSLTYGLSAYQILGAEQVVASTGINPQTILTSACIELADGSKVTVLDAMSRLNPAKIYIMLGSNGVAFLSKETIIDCYGQLIDALIAQHPNSTIYLESILPVTASKENGDSRYANARINEYNAAIAQLAVDKGVQYVNVAEALKNEYGCLPEEASADGMHFGPKTYRKWLNYLLP